jgi:hypothetical protein
MKYPTRAVKKTAEVYTARTITQHTTNHDISAQNFPPFPTVPTEFEFYPTAPGSSSRCM